MRNKSQNLLIYLVIGLWIISCGSIFGQSSPDEVRSVATFYYRHGFVAGFNPAVLGLRTTPRMTIFLPSAYSSLGNNAFSPQYIGDTFVEGKWLDFADKQDILSKIKSDNIDLYGHGALPLFGITSGSYGFNLMNLNYQMSGSIPQDILDLALNGWEKDRNYSFDTAEGETYSYWTTSFYLAKSLNPYWIFEDFSLGLTFRYIRGLNYWGLGETSGKFQVTGTSIEAEGLYEYLSAKSGDGLGLDVGIACWLRPLDAFVGLTGGNLLGNINWPSVEVREIRFERHRGVDLDSLASGDYWERFFNESDTTYWQGSFVSPLPRYLELSIYKPSVYLGEKGDIFASIYQGLNDVPGYSLIPKLTVGTELRMLPFFHTWGELGFGGVEGVEFGGGFGFYIHGYEFSLGADWQRGAFGSAKGFSIAMRNYFSLPPGGEAREVYVPKPRKAPKVKAKPIEKPIEEPAAEPVAEPVVEPDEEPIAEPEVVGFTLPEPPSGMKSLTMADLGLKEMDPGQQLFREELFPFVDNPVYYQEVGNEKYDKFFKDAAILSGTVLVAKRVITAVKEKNKVILKLYKLLKKPPFVKLESPFYRFIAETLPQSGQKAKELVSIGASLPIEARTDFTGMNARKLPKVIKGVYGSVKNIKVVQDELPELIEMLSNK